MNKNYERKEETSEAMIYGVISRIMVHRLAKK